METLITKHSLLLGGPKDIQEITPFAIDPMTERLRITISRPTSVTAVTWDDTSTMKVVLGIEVDGKRIITEGQSTGGVRSREGGEHTVYSLDWQLPSGYFGSTDKIQRRIGEKTLSSFRAFATFEHIKGNPIATDVFLEGISSELVQLPFHNSVTYESQTSVAESAGDGVVSVNHTAGGTDRVAILGVGVNSSFGSAAGTATYGGASATSIDTIDGFFSQVAMFYYIAPATSSQAVVSDLTAAAPDRQILGVVILNGADQSTPIGNTQEREETSGASPSSLTVTSVGADDMCVDVFYDAGTASDTVGADQDERISVTSGFPDAFKMSTQPGASGGVMSWTWTGSHHVAHIAARIIAAAAGGSVVPVIMRQFRGRWG